MAMDEGSDDEDEDQMEGIGDEEEENGDEEESAAGGGSSNTLSAHERQQERMKAKLTKLEQQQLAEKPWQLKGEVNAQKRPKNSLLEADLDFEQGSKAAPVITEEVRPFARATSLSSNARRLSRARTHTCRGCKH